QVVVPNEDYRKTLGEAFVEAADLGHVYVGTEHILLAILKLNNQAFINDLGKSGLNYESIRQELLSFGTYQPGIFTKKNQNVEGMEEEDEADNALAYFGQNMVENARQGKYLPILGRKDEI